MAIDWNSLNNITDITFNLSQIQDSSGLTNTLIDNADVVSQGYYGLGVMIITFLIMMVILFKDDDDIRMDIVRTIMISSGFTTIIGVIGLTLNIFSSFTHVMWFFVIFVASTIAVLFLKKKGL